MKEGNVKLHSGQIIKVEYYKSNSFFSRLINLLSYLMYSKKHDETIQRSVRENW